MTQDTTKGTKMPNTNSADNAILSLIRASEMLLSNLAEFDGRCTDPEFHDGVESALTALREVYRVRREECPWKGPFHGQTVQRDNWPSAQVYDTAELLSSKRNVGLTLYCQCDDDAVAIAAALNEYYGYFALDNGAMWDAVEMKEVGR